MRDHIFHMTTKSIHFNCGTKDEREDVILTSNMFFVGCKFSENISFINSILTYQIAYYLSAFASFDTIPVRLHFEDKDVAQKAYKWIAYQARIQLKPKEN